MLQQKAKVGSSQYNRLRWYCPVLSNTSSLPRRRSWWLIFPCVLWWPKEGRLIPCCPLLEAPSFATQSKRSLTLDSISCKLTIASGFEGNDLGKTRIIHMSAITSLDVYNKLPPRTQELNSGSVSQLICLSSYCKIWLQYFLLAQCHQGIRLLNDVIVWTKIGNSKM